MKKKGLKFCTELSGVLNKLVHPLQEHFSISLIIYSKIYLKDLKYIWFSSDQDFTSKFLLNFCKGNIFFREYINNSKTINSEYEFLLWPLYPSNDLMHLHHSHGYWHGVSLLKTTDEYIECWGFLSDVNNYMIDRFYARNPDLLEKYTEHIRSHIYEMVKRARVDQYFGSIESLDLSIPNNIYKQEREEVLKFLVGLTGGKNILRVRGQLIRLSDRQLQCLELLSKGFTMKTIGRELSLSSRTIESHLYTLKIKTGYYYKDDLIKLYQDSL